MTALLAEGSQLGLVPDMRPPAEGDGPSCTVCGSEIEWGGRGRRPTKCAEHKGKRDRAAKTPAAATGTAAKPNEKLAGQAADVLCQLNEFGAAFLALGRLFGTAAAVTERTEAFREQAYEALLLDPSLCRAILRSGARSGKAALLMAYGLLGMSVAPVAMEEIRELRAERAKAAAAREAEAE